MVVPKGNALETPSNNPKKIKLVKASEAEAKKSKLLASVMSTTKTVKVCYRCVVKSVKSTIDCQGELYFRCVECYRPHFI